VPAPRARPRATEHQLRSVTVWQIATALPLRHLPGMNLPIVLAEAGMLSEASPIGIGLAITIGGAIAAGLVMWAKGSATSESNQTTLRQDLNAEIADRKDALKAEKEAREKLEREFNAARDASSKRQDDTGGRLSQLEARQLQTDTRMGGLENHLINQDAKLDRMDANIMKILMGDVAVPRRRKDDAA
jgi:hypothetical protein